jgi:hypothetical protein
MPRRSRLLAVALLPLFTAALSAQTAPSVERVGPARVVAQPGGQVTAAFRVRAPAGAAAALEPSLPAGWRAVSPAAPLAAGTADVRLVAAMVPRGAAAGTYVLRLRARAGASAAADSVRVDVGERRALEVTVEEAPRFAVAGEPYAAVFGVANRGNARAVVRLATTSSRGWPAAAEATSLALEPGERRSVRVTVRTRAAAGPATHLLRLTALAGTDSAARGTALARVAVVARGNSATEAARRTMPALVTLRARQGGATPGGVPAAISVSGPLGAGGTRMDLFYRGRGAVSAERGEAEQLSLGLRGRRGELLAGDQYWILSPLTAPGRAGYGAGGRLRAGPAWVEGFSARDRSPGSPWRTGGALGVGGDGASLSANYASGADGAAVSLRGRARPVPGVGVDAEYGAAGAARAANVELRGGGKTFRFTARALEADAGFPGDQGGRSLRRVEVAARPAGPLRLYGGYERDTRADSVAGVPIGAEVSARTLRAGAALGSLATLERRSETRAGTGRSGPWARDAESWVATAGLRARHGSLSGGAQLGDVRDRISGATSPFGREWVRGEVRMGAHSLRAGVERRTGSVVDTAGVARFSGELGVSLQPWASTLLTVAATGSGTAWTEERDGLVDARIEQRLPGGQALRLQVRALPWAEPGRRRPTVLLDYEIPLRLPLGRAAQPGTVGGRVMDNETGRPIPGALVRVGDRAVMTDGRGRWAVVGLAAGAHRVELDPVSIGVGRVVAQPDALAVTVAGGRRVPVEIGVSRSARVHGEIALPGGGGVPGAVVELRSGDDRRRRTTDAAGRFLFSDLAPGRWTLVVIEADLPPHHALDRRTLEVELAAGEEGLAHFQAVERLREMKIVAGGEVVLGAPPVRGAQPAVPAVPSTSTSPAAPPVDQAPAAREVERPWRTRGETGLSDWADDSYVVQPGDEGLIAIAWFVYRDGSLWPRLWLANRDRLASPNVLAPGLELVIPPFGPLTAEERAAGAARGPTRRGPQHRGRRGVQGATAVSLLRGAAHADPPCPRGRRRRPGHRPPRRRTVPLRAGARAVPRVVRRERDDGALPGRGAAGERLGGRGRHPLVRGDARADRRGRGELPHRGGAAQPAPAQRAGGGALPVRPLRPGGRDAGRGGRADAAGAPGGEGPRDARHHPRPAHPRERRGGAGGRAADEVHRAGDAAAHAHRRAHAGAGRVRDPLPRGLPPKVKEWSHAETRRRREDAKPLCVSASPRETILF